MESVTPQLIGRVQGAQRSTRFLPSEEGKRMMATGEKIEKAGDMVGDQLENFVGMFNKHNEGVFSQSMLDIERQADEIYHEEVTSHRGASAMGATDRLTERYGKLVSEFRERIPFGFRDRFEESWQRYYNGRMRSARGYEFQETQRATESAYTQIQNSAIDRATQSLDSGARADATAEAIEAFTRNHSQQNGGHVYTPESLAAFDADYQDGNSSITLPGRRSPDGTVTQGRTYTIVEDDEYHGEEGYIPRSRIVAFRAQMAQQADAYQSGVTAIHDAINTKTVTALLQNNMVAEAESFLNEADSEGRGSAGVRSTLSATVARHREVLLDTEEVHSAVRTIVGDQRYYSESMEARYTELQSKISTEYAGEPERRDRIASELHTRWAAVKADMKAQLDRDVAVSLNGLANSNLATWGEKVRAMEDSPLKAQLMTILERREAAVRSAAANTPEFHYQQQRALQMFKLAVSKGESVDLEGVTYDLSKPEEVIAFMQAQGFVGDYAQQAGRYAATRPEARPDMGKIYSAVTSTLGLSVTVTDITRQKEQISALARYLEQRCLQEVEPGKVDVQTLRVWAAEYILKNLPMGLSFQLYLPQSGGGQRQ